MQYRTQYPRQGATGGRRYLLSQLDGPATAPDGALAGALGAARPSVQHGVQVSPRLVTAGEGETGGLSPHQLDGADHVPLLGRVMPANRLMVGQKKQDS